MNATDGRYSTATVEKINDIKYRARFLVGNVLFLELMDVGEGVATSPRSLSIGGNGIL